MSEKQQVLFEIYLENGEFKVKAKESSESLNNVTQETKKGEKSFKDYLKAGLAIGGVTLVVRKIFTMLKNSAKAASDLEETTSKFNVVFKDVEKQANKNAAALQKSFGFSQKQAKAFLADTGDLLTGLGMAQDKALDLSTAVVELGTDLASFSNYAGGAAGAVEALTKGLLGEREMMKGLGIVINEEMLMNELRAQGKDKLTGLALNQAKAEATLTLAMQQSKNAIGDTERSFNSMVNVQRRVESRMENISAKMGGDLIPELGLLGQAFLDASEDGGVLANGLLIISKTAAVAIDAVTRLINLFNYAQKMGQKAGAESFIKKASSEVNAEIKRYEGEAKALRITAEELIRLKAKMGGADSEAAQSLKFIEARRKKIAEATADMTEFDNQASDFFDKTFKSRMAELEELKNSLGDRRDRDNKTGGAPPGMPKEGDIVKYYQDIGNIRQSHLQRINQEEQFALANAKLMLQQKLISEQEYQSALLAIREETRQQEVIAEATAWQEKAAASERYYRARLGMESAVWQGTASIAQAGAALMNEKNKALFMVGKVSALTNIAMNTAEGITAGYKWGPFIGSANAAMLGVLGAVQAKNILKQKPPEPAKLKNPEIEIPTLPSYAVGAWNIPKDHVAQLHRGEMVLPKSFAEDYRNKAEGGGNTTIIVQGNVVDTEGIFQVVHAAQKDLQKRSGTDAYSRPSVYGR